MLLFGVCRKIQLDSEVWSRNIRRHNAKYNFSGDAKTINSLIFFKKSEAKNANKRVLNVVC